jgi:hypothetical protein
MPTAVTQGDFLRQGTSGWEAKSLSEVSTDLEASLAKKDLSNVSTPVDLELKGYFETVNALTAGATVDIDFSLGNIAELTVNQATSLTFSNLPPSGKSGSIQLKLSGGASFAITFPACVSWNGDVPELASTGTTPDIIEFETSDGGTVVNAWLIKEGA